MSGTAGIYKIVNNQIVVEKRFVDLWKILRNDEPFLYRGSGVIRDIPHPQAETSNLVGIPIFFDPVTPVRLYSFEIVETNGPMDQLIRVVICYQLTTILLLLRFRGGSKDLRMAMLINAM
ncbi:Hypothetical protein POVR1_LOCUS118 [uncultured virus]|nr:Hypothetical protein POVR1_LOCUS118 [uncultured virus]